MVSYGNESCLPLYCFVDAIIVYLRAWGIINLPIGNYSLLFRVNTETSFPYSFAIDDINIISCDYPLSSISYDSLLSFACDFDNSTMCDMMNDEKTASLNFTVTTGDSIPDQDLGPTRDHTMNSTSGGFLYWSHQLPVNISDRGRIYLSKKIEQNSGMCIRFAYYVKSKSDDNNTMVIRLSADGDSSTGLWYQSLADSYGWQLVLVPLANATNTITFYFDVYRLEPILTSVALDDIEIDQCDSFITTTTSTITTTTSILSTTTSISSTSTETTSITSVSTSMTVSSNHASQRFSLNIYHLIVGYFLIYAFQYIFD